MYDIPRANANIFLTGIVVTWNPPLFMGNLNRSNLQYQISWNDKILYSNNTWVETFENKQSYLENVHVAVISSPGHSSDNGPIATYLVRGDCIRKGWF